MKTHLHVDCLGFQLTGHKRVSASDFEGGALVYRATYFSETGWHLHQMVKIQHCIQNLLGSGRGEDTHTKHGDVNF